MPFEYYAACEQLWEISIKISETGFGNVRKFHEILLVFSHTGDVETAFIYAE